MKSSFLRQAAALGVAAAALLCAAGASAQAPSPFSYEVDNLTASGGDPVFSVTDPLVFSNLQINEVFADSTTATIPLPNLDTNTISEFAPFNFDGTHGFLASATLTGSIAAGALTTVNLQQMPGGPTTPEQVFTSFSTSLFFPVQNTSPTGVALGQFSLLYNNNTFLPPTIITVQAVPEASTVVSMGLILALGLGTLLGTRRRATSAK